MADVLRSPVAIASLLAVLAPAPMAGAEPLAPAGAGEQMAWLQGWDARGDPFDLHSLRDQVVVLTFASKKTRDDATDINDSLAELARPGTMTVVSVVDLEDIPGFGRPTALKRISEADRPGLIHIVDPHGGLSRSFGVDPKHDVDILVIDRTGIVRGHFVGERGLEEARRLISQME